MKYVMISLFMMNLAFGKTVSEPMTVVKMNWSEDKKMFRLTMLEQAAVYWAPKSLEPCLLKSLNRQKNYEMQFNTSDSIIDKCKKLD